MKTALACLLLGCGSVSSGNGESSSGETCRVNVSTDDVNKVAMGCSKWESYVVYRDGKLVQIYICWGDLNP